MAHKVKIKLLLKSHIYLRGGKNTQKEQKKMINSLKKKNTKNEKH